MDGNSKMPFGKYEGQLLKDISDGYLQTLYDAGKLSGELKSYTERRIPILWSDVQRKLREQRNWKVISIQQPWATLIVMGAKKIETRSWKTEYRGPLLIHASAGKKEAMRFCEVPGTPPFDQFIRHWSDLPYGALLGVVTLDRIFSTNERLQLSDQEASFGDFSIDRYGWVLSNPIKFKTPIPAKGALSIWDWKGEIEI